MSTVPVFRRAAVGLIGAFLFAQAAPPLQKKQPATKKQDTFINGAPFTFEQVLGFIRQNVIPPRRQKEAIQNRGLNFSLSVEDFNKLKAAGASADMLQLIFDRAKPVPVKPPEKVTPPPPKVGDLDLTCAPAECEISVGGAVLGTTSGGALKITGLRAGPTAVDFKRAGYIGSQAQVTIQVGKTATAKATLLPERATKEAFGDALFKKMAQALGGEAAVRESLSVQAEGSATLWSPGGAATRWSLIMRNRPERALFQAQGGGGVLHEIAFVGSQFKTSKGLKGNDARDLPTHFGMLRDRQLAGLIGLLSTAKFKMVADQDVTAGGRDLVLTAEGSTQTITIGLDGDLRPAQVKFKTATGLGSEIVTYSDYVQQGKVYYPKSMQIKPDETPRGIEVHLDRVEIAPKLKDADYNLKGKPIPSLVR
jgi:hypothetical protein